MKIGVISDIHGNLEALQAVLEDIKEQGCEKIFMLGDYAMAGPNPKETVDKIFKMQFDKNISMIQGNTDLMLVNYNDALYEELKQKAPVMAEALRNDVMQINPIQKNFLKELPIQLQVEEEGVKILLVHGSPRKNNEDIHPNLGVEQVEEMAFEKVEKFATLMSFLKIQKNNIQIFEITENYVHLKMTDEEGDIYEFTFTAGASER